VVDNLIKFLLLRLRKDDNQGSGLSKKYIQSLCKKYKGSLPAAVSVLRQDGWIPASISDQVLSFEYDKYLFKEPSPQIGTSG